MEKTTHKLTISIIAMFLLTALHHLYGGIIYNSSFRINGTIWGAVLLIITLILLRLLPQKKNKILTMSFLFLVWFVWIGSIGLFEGGYNHVLKNILFFAGVSVETLNKFYPSSLHYELPDNIFFEITGVLQFPLSFVIRNYLQRYLKEVKR